MTITFRELHAGDHSFSRRHQLRVVWMLWPHVLGKAMACPKVGIPLHLSPPFPVSHPPARPLQLVPRV